MDERTKRIYLARLSGEDVSAIAKREGIHRTHVYRILAGLEPVKARVGVQAQTVEGPLTPNEIATAIRAYAERMGIVEAGK